MTEEKRVSLNIIDQIAHVTLSRAEKHNALDMKMFYEIDNTIKILRKNTQIRAVIVSGDGDDFCSGIDIKSVINSPVNGLKLLFKILPWRSNLAQRVSTAWQKIPVPVIMAIHGRCWGGGLQIALGGDFRIATCNASLSILESRWGIIPDMGGTVALRNIVNVDVAKELAMTAAIIDGERALSLGLVTHVSNEPLVKAQQLADIISQQSPDSVAATKTLYNKSWSSTKGMALLRESYYQIKILLGKNQQIKTYNQLHEKQESKTFKERRKW
ncbi:MAG: enoyl-CoA hydratase/carnithine racemase [Alteromonadaceae bacterium]|jgi:enoyl-CoA hydratase/carnithine racemase